MTVEYPPHLYLPKHRRTLALHRLVAEKVRRDPSLIDDARARLERWKEMNTRASVPYYITDWTEILDRGLEATLAFMIDEGEYATQLRQSSPFSCMLTQQERWAFLAEWRDKMHRDSNEPT